MGVALREDLEGLGKTAAAGLQLLSASRDRRGNRYHRSGFSREFFRETFIPNVRKEVLNGTISPGYALL